MTRRVLIFGLKLLISAALVWWLLLHVELAALAAQLASLQPSILAAVFVLLLLHGAVSAWRWWSIMRLQGDRQSYRSVLQLFFIGMFFNQTLSTTLGGDAARVLLLRQDGRPAGTAVAGVVMERAAGLLGLLLLIPFAMFLAPESAAVLGLLAGGLGIIAAIVLGARLHDAAWPPVAWLGSFLQETRRVLLSPSSLPVLLLSVAIHLGGGLSVYLLGLAAGATLDLLVCLTLVPLVLLLATLPVSLGGWGVREAALVGLFAPFGVAADQALSVSVALGLLVMAAGLPGGVLWLMRGRKRSAQPTAPG